MSFPDAASPVQPSGSPGTIRPDLRWGLWQDVLADVAEVDAVITDPPFSPRTAKGYKTNPQWQKGSIGDQAGVSYGSITEADARALVESWAPRTRYWIVVFGDHVSCRWWEAALQGVGWYTFAPVAWVKTAAPPRFLADGPASQTEWIMVGRPKSNRYKERRGSRPGWYAAKRGDSMVTGAKDMVALRRLVSHYAAPGDLVVDPFAGSATTLLAAALEGRRAIGAEIDATVHAKGIRRIEAGLPEVAA